MEDQKKKRRVIKPIEDIEFFVDSDDWEIVVDFVEKWFHHMASGDVDMRRWSMAMKHLALFVYVEPNDEAKRITKFSAPEFVKKIMVYCPDQFFFGFQRHVDVFALDFDRVSSLDRLAFLELTGMKVSPSLPGLRGLEYLRHVEINIENHDLNDRHIDLFDEILRLPNLKILEVGGYAHLLSYLTSERGRDNQGPDLEELHMNWNLEIKNLKPAQRKLVAKPDFFAGRFVNLKTLGLGRRREFNNRFGWQFIRCSWISTRLETLYADVFELNESLPEMKDDPAGVDTFNVQDLVIYLQAASLDQKILSSVFERVARCMRSIRRLRLLVCNHCYWAGRQPPKSSCNFFEVPLSKLYPLKSTLEHLTVRGFSPGDYPEEKTLGCYTLDSGGHLLLLPSLDERPRWQCRLIPKLQMQDIRHLSNLKSIELTNFGFDDEPLLKSDVSNEHGNDPAESGGIMRSPEKNLGAKPSADCVSMSRPPYEGFPVLHEMELMDWKSVDLVMNEDGDGPEQSESQTVASAYNFVASLDLSQLRVLDLSSLDDEPPDIQAWCEKVLSKCSRLEILNIRTLDAKMDTSSAILACTSKQLQVAHLGRPLVKDEPLPCAIKALWSIANKFPMLGSTCFSRYYCSACVGDSNLLYPYWLNRARWRLMANGLPSVGVWPRIFSGARKAFERHPKDNFSEEDTDVTEADAVYLLLRKIAVEKLFS